MADSAAETTAAPEDFRIEEERARDLTVLTVHGDFDLHVAPELRDRLDEVIDAGASTVVLDLGSLTFLDSSALGVLLRGMKRLQARGGRLRLVVPRAEIRRVFEITLLDSVFELDSSRDAAVPAGARSAV
jgi:anti-sigma B factor antagonist